MEFKDYYATMGVARGASQDEIKKAYRKLARKYHPDVSKEPDAEARFKEISEAYEVLRDPEKRAAYDQLGAAPRRARSSGRRRTGTRASNSGAVAPTGEEYVFGGVGGFDASEFFETLFGAPARRGARMRAVRRARAARTITPGDDRPGGRLPEAAAQHLTLRVPGSCTGPCAALRGSHAQREDPERHSRRPAHPAGRPGRSRHRRGARPATCSWRSHSPAPRLPARRPRPVYLDLPVAPWEAALGRDRHACPRPAVRSS